ncbi:MAG TPA: PIN-like domain-containing protein, partial [Pirellulales bacterium]|nr:PIN-like domain-containing protein [Pirellulales bacterium]
SREASDKFLDILNGLRARLFLPHQVAMEFFHHLEETIADQWHLSWPVHRDAAESFRQELFTDAVATAFPKGADRVKGSKAE